MVVKKRFGARQIAGIIQVLFTLAAFCALALFYDVRSVMQSISRLSILFWTLVLVASAMQIMLPVERVATFIRSTPLWFIGALIERSHQLFRLRLFAVDAMSISLVIQVMFVAVFIVIGQAIVPAVPWSTLGAFASVLLLASLI